MKRLITLLTLSALFSCTMEPIQLTNSELANIQDIQVMKNTPRRDTVEKYFGVIRQEVGMGITLDNAHQLMQLKAYNRGGNAVVNMRVTYFTGASSHKSYPDYITGEVVLLRNN